ncbi:MULTISPECIES: site-specific DNA-methyltransferase [Myxococcus]|uniref:site-specific DNA-methyltransferase n=1 Tax=Myxococcus TaxID=32 RepID=UPI001CEDD148|nr:MULTISPECIES: site-specific DNA-methyltransferase [Myxococcus]UYI15847.1 site-specific DNA-methyltransferase [Myxococcus xanthus]UYI23210.1 site-specific DNA-methyltransferase [Myxococcus xanthus]
MNNKLLTNRAALFVGDAARVGEVLAPDSVDAIVTDPPAGIGFMGREWDSDKGGRDAWIAWLSGVMREALRVLKPGDTRSSGPCRERRTGRQRRWRTRASRFAMS